MNLLTFACWVTHSDPELAQECGQFDKMMIILNAAALLLAATLALIVWTVFFIQFMAPQFAIPLAILIAGVIFLVDQRMAASDWELAGVLRQSALAPSWYGRVAARIGVALLLAYATATGALLALFSDTITEHQQVKRTAQNAAIEEEYSVLKTDVRKRLIGPLESELGALGKERDQLQLAMQTNLARQEEAQSRASNARIEADREAVGGRVGGAAYVRGMGPRWAEAQRQQREADRLAVQASKQVADSKAAIQQIADRMDEKNAQLQKANREYERQRGDLDGQKIKDSRFGGARDDALMRYMSLVELERDPKYGPAVREFESICKAVLICLELAFMALKMIFSPASTYTVRLITKTKLDAMQAAMGYGDARDALRRQHPDLRIVPRDNPRRNDDGDRDAGRQPQ